MEFGPSFWVALSFFIFIGLILKPVGGFIVKALDQRASKIKDELGEALRLKEEAQALLSSYQRKQKEVVEEAEKILKEAEEEATRIAKNSEKELEEALNKRVEIAMQKIASYEATVLQQVKNNSVDIAISTVRSLLIENSNKDVTDELITNALGDISKKLH